MIHLLSDKFLILYILIIINIYLLFWLIDFIMVSELSGVNNEFGYETSETNNEI